MNRFALALALAFLMLLPQSSARGTPIRESRDLEEVLQETAAIIPEFGGISADVKRRVVTIRVTDQNVAKARKVVDLLATKLEDKFLSSSSLIVVRAEFPLSDLFVWRDAVRSAVLAIPDVVFLDVDEARGILRIGASSEPGVSSARSTLIAHGVPSAATAVEVVPEIRPATSLRDLHRPLVGGLQIQFQRSAGSYNCTLGFIAVRSGVRGFVTNSHCTATQGGVESTVYYQPDVLLQVNRIGVETVDPAYWTGGSCPSGRRCRYSDSAFAALDTGILSSLGSVAKLDSYGSYDWNGIDTYSLNNEGTQLVGYPVQKVGRTSGRTVGNVTQTCADTNVSGTSITLLCQTFTNMIVLAGDSGSPVLFFSDVFPEPSDNGLVGLVWGSGSNDYGVYSTISRVQRSGELGTLTNCTDSTC